MSAIGEVSPGSFDSYEGIRILIPGAIVSAVAYLVAGAVAPAAQINVSGDAITWIVASLTTGLVLYFLDLPSKSAAFHELQPTNYLEKAFPGIPRGEILTTYLLMLNTVMPANTRNRALYIGSMYRIGFEMIVFGGAGTAVVFACSQLDYGSAVAYDRLVVAGSASIVILAYIIGLGLTSAARARSRKRARSVSGSNANNRNPKATGYFWPTVTWVAGAVLVIISLGLSGSVFWAAFFLVGFSASVASWVWLYSAGLTRKGEAARARPELTGAMFGIPILACLILPRGEYTILGGAGASVAWSSAAALVIIMSMSGGHEGKLHGVYRGQTRWLKDHQDDVEALFDGKKSTAPPATK